MTEDIAALTDIAREARETAALGQGLEALAERIEAAIDALADQAGVTVDEVYSPLWQD
jgi:polygalacturonase